MRVLIAPGLAGPLHLQGARLALAGELLARAQEGARLLWLDDALPARAAQAPTVTADLRWLGLEPDGEIHVSARRALYEAAAGRLRGRGLIYPCFESEEELAAKRDRRQRRGEPTIYDRAMLKLTEAQRQAAEAGGKRPYWRLRLSGRSFDWDDLVLGRQSVKLGAVSDPVVVAADGTPLGLFAAAVDLMEEGITHLLRPAERLTGAGLLAELLDGLGAARPRLGHLPPIEAPARPRHTLPALRTLRADGIEPRALAGYLAALGTGTAPVAGTPAALARRFEPARLGRRRACIDPAALLTLNRKVLGELTYAEVRDRLPAAATPAFWDAVRGHLDLLGEARLWWEVVAGDVAPAALPADLARAALAALPPEPWDGGTWHAWLRAVGADHAAALRLALTGEEAGPPMPALLALLGRARVAARLGTPDATRPD